MQPRAPRSQLRDASPGRRSPPAAHVDMSSPRLPTAAAAAAAPQPAPAPVDLDEDIRNRTPSGWPMQARRRGAQPCARMAADPLPPPLALAFPPPARTRPRRRRWKSTWQGAATGALAGVRTAARAALARAHSRARATHAACCTQPAAGQDARGAACAAVARVAAAGALRGGARGGVQRRARARARRRRGAFAEHDALHSHTDHSTACCAARCVLTRGCGCLRRGWRASARRHTARTCC